VWFNKPTLSHFSANLSGAIFCNFFNTVCRSILEVEVEEVLPTATDLKTVVEE